MTARQTILTRYSHLPGHKEQVLNSLCALLAENPAGVAWAVFGLDEWALLYQVALQESVAAVAYYLLRTAPETYHLASFDRQTYQLLAEQEALTALRNALLFRNLERLQTVLGQRGMPVVLLKGADLARSLYPQPGLRPMGDIDLLVLKERFEEALDLVKTAGYYEDIPEASPGFDRALSHHVHLRKEGTAGTLLELHWTLVAPALSRYAAPMDWFWQNLEPLKDWRGNSLGAPEGTVVLNPTANLLYLSAHQMLQHSGEELSLRWLLDLHRLVERRREDIDWQVLVAQASQFGWCGALSAALEAAQSCFATWLPGGLLEALHAQAGLHGVMADRQPASPPTRTLIAWKELKSLNWRGRIRLLLTRFFPSPAYVRWRYPARPGWFLPFSYVRFACDLARDSWRTLRYLLNLPSKRT